MSEKRRKLNDEEFDFRDSSEIISSLLSGFEEHCEKMLRRNPEWKIGREDLLKMLRNEKEVVLQKIHKRFNLEKSGKRRIGSRNWNKAVVDIFFQTFDVQTRRIIEEMNIREIDRSKNIVFRLRGVQVPDHVVISILSFFRFDRNLLLSIGRTCKKFYLLILSNWGSTVKLCYNEYSEYGDHSDQTTNLYQISLLVLRSMKHLQMKNFSSKNGIEYLHKQLNMKNNLQKLSFRDCRVQDIELFFQVANNSKFQLFRCRTLELPYFHKSDDQKEIKTVKSEDILSVCPNLLSIVNPFPHHLGTESFSRLQNLSSVDKDFCFDVLQHKNPERVRTLIYIPSTDIEHYHVSTYQRSMRDIVNTFPQLRNLRYSCSIEEEDCKGLKIDWDFLQNSQIEALQIDFRDVESMWFSNNVCAFSFREIFNSFCLHLPQSVKKLVLKDPPLKLFLDGLENYYEDIEDIRLTFSKFFRKEIFVWGGRRLFEQKTLDRVNEVCETLVSMKKRIRKVKMLVYRSGFTDLNTDSDFLQFELSKRKKMCRIFIFSGRSWKKQTRWVQIRESSFEKKFLCKCMFGNIKMVNWSGSGAGSGGLFNKLCLYFRVKFHMTEDFPSELILPDHVEERVEERLVVRKCRDSFIVVPNKGYFGANHYETVPYKRRIFYSVNN